MKFMEGRVKVIKLYAKGFDDLVVEAIFFDIDYSEIITVD